MNKINSLLEKLKTIEGYPFDILKDGPLISSLTSEFPNVDFDEELARLALWLSDLPPGPRIHYRLLLRKWIVNASRKTSPSTTSSPQTETSFNKHTTY